MLLQSEKVSQREFRSDRGRGVRNGLAVAVILVALVGWAGIGRAAGHSAAKADVPGDAKSPPGFMTMGPLGVGGADFPVSMVTKSFATGAV